MIERTRVINVLVKVAVGLESITLSFPPVQR